MSQRMSPAASSRTVRLHHPVQLGAMLAPLRRGSGDPTYRIEGRGPGAQHWRASRTPEGLVTWCARQLGDRVEVDAWGEGSTWALDAMPRLLGEEDRGDDFAACVADHPMLAHAQRRYGTPVLGATGLVMEALLPAIIEQKVTGQEAFAGYRRLVQRYGERAPGPREDLWAAPGPGTLRTIPSWAWLKLPVDPARSRAVLTAARVAPSLERTLGLPGDEVTRRLTSLPGIGEWTAAEVRSRAHGDPDAVSFGDYHVAKEVGWALTGEPWDDEQLRAFLEPFRPHRGRVVSLIYTAKGHRPRRGPRMAPRTHLPE